MSVQHCIVSFTDRHERIRNIADKLDAFLERVEGGADGQKPLLPVAGCEALDYRELHQLRGYCEQLRCDAESLKNGADGFGKGVKEVASE